MLTDEQKTDDATLDVLEGRAKSKRSIDARWMLRLIADLRASQEQVERMRGVVEAATFWYAANPHSETGKGRMEHLQKALKAYEESNDAAKS